MAGRIRQADVDEVKARTNIADIIGERVALKPAGVGAMKGLCPFHDERSPSFNVRPQAGFYHCFGCGESGDVYSFLRNDGPRVVHRGGRAPRRAHRLHAALRGRGSGPRDDRPHAPVRRERRRRGVLPRAAGDRRGRRRPPLPRASAGSTPAPPRTSASATRRKGWSSMHSMRCTRSGFSDEELSTAGLVSQGQRGVYDRFRGRVDLADPRRDRPGDRLRRAPALRRRQRAEVPQHPRDDDLPQGAGALRARPRQARHLARSPRRRRRGLHRRDGVPPRRASRRRSRRCGTAFGSDHITVLRRVMGDDSAAGEVVFTFDPDAAGQKAALRAFADAKRFNAQTYVAVGPEGLDPCDLRLQRGDGAVRALIDTKVPMVEFVIDQRIVGLRPRHRRGPRRRAPRGGARRRRAARPARCSPSTSACSRAASASTPRTCGARSSARRAAASASAREPAHPAAARAR